MSDEEMEPSPDDTMRMILTTFAGTASEQVEKFRARAREFHEEAESAERRAVDRHALAREYDQAADLLQTYQDAGHKAASALREQVMRHGGGEPAVSRPKEERPW